MLCFSARYSGRICLFCFVTRIEIGRKGCPLLLHVVFRCLLLRNDFQPVAVRIRDEIDSHRRIFKADAAHLFVEFMCCFKIICAESEMEFTVTQIIGAVEISQPGQLQFEICGFVSEIYDNKGAILCVDPSLFF